jgi:hypothetical protein
VILGDIDLAQDAKGSQSMTYRLPMTEVARPGLAIFGDTYIWSDVVTDYATWSAILAEPVATWADLIDKVGTSEVIVP